MRFSLCEDEPGAIAMVTLHPRVSRKASGKPHQNAVLAVASEGGSQGRARLVFCPNPFILAWL